MAGAGSCAAVVLAACAVAQSAANGLPEYGRESAFLVETPGTTASAAGGFFNPASWAVQPHGGFFLGFDDATGSEAGAFAAALSLRHLGFGVRQFHVAPAGADDFRVRDYTLGIGGGTRAHAWGLAYGWGGGDLDRAPRHERLVVGSIYRCRFGSLGSATTWDLERRDHAWQVDVGVRPVGPRVTLFADAEYRRGESFDDIRTGYGLEARLLPGLAVAAKRRNDGEIALRVGIALDRLSWIGMRAVLDDGGTRTASTYAADLGGPHASLGLGGLAPRRFPVLSLRGTMAYQRYRFLDKRPTLPGALRAIDAVAVEPQAAGVLVDLAGARIGPVAAWELRAQLAGLRARGKRVLVYCDRPGLYQLLLASVADEIWLHPSGLVDASGLASGRTYMRRALDELGLGVDEWRFFTYKSAFEGYSRDSMSEPDREQRQALVDDFYAAIAAAIGAGRGIDRARFDALVDGQAVLRPEEAQAFGLVDSIGDFEAMRRHAPRSVRRAQSGDAAAVATLGDLFVDPVWGEEAWGEPPRLALLYAIGPCEMESGIRGRALADAIRAASRDRRVRAIVLRVDSPGGDVLPSDLVARAIREARARKPVVVSQGQVAASGGYWISMDADTILASPFTITGSIGVIGGWIWNERLGDRLGLDYDGVQRGAHADLVRGIELPLLGVTVPDRPLGADERARVETLIRGTYGDFVRDVARARGLEEAAVDAVAQGRVWSGSRARAHGLVDEEGGLWEALRVARARAGLLPGRAVEVVEGPARGWFDPRALQRRFLGGSLETSDAALGASTVLAADAAPAGLAPWFDPRAEIATTPGGMRPVERAFLDLWLRHNGRPLVVVPPIAIEDGVSLP